MNRLALILLCLAALAAPSTLAQTTTLLEAGAFAAGPILHDGRVVSLRTAPGGGTRLVRLDPATGRTAETPLPAPGGRLSYGKLLSLAGRLYVQTSDDVSYEDGPLFALDGPAFAPAPADPRLASIDPYELGQSSGERAFAPLAADGDADGEAKALSEIGADGRVTPLEAPATGGRYYPTPVGDAVYYVVERPDGQDYSYTLWRASGGRATAADVLPAGAGTVSGLAAAGDTLIIAAADGERGPTRLYRLAPGAARATPVPGFETPNGFSQSVFRTVGDVLFFTVATSNDSGADSGGRVRLYRQRGTSAPAQVPNLDLGGEATFFASSARTFDGALYVGVLYAFRRGSVRHQAEPLPRRPRRRAAARRPRRERRQQPAAHRQRLGVRRGRREALLRSPGRRRPDARLGAARRAGAGAHAAAWAAAVGDSLVWGIARRAERGDVSRVPPSTPMARSLLLASLLLALATPAQAQWEILPTPRRSYNNAPLPAEAFTTFNGTLVGAFDDYDASDGCASCHVTFVSADAGQTWTLTRDPDGAIFSMGTFDRRDGALFGSHGYPSDAAHNGRVYRSADGVAWTLAAPATGGSSLYNVQATADGTLWAAGTDGDTGRTLVERSIAGSAWANVTGEIDNQYGGAPVGSTATRVFARTAFHVYVREASTGPWATVPYFDSGGPRGIDDDGETLYASATITRSLPAPPYFSQSFMQRSADGGTTWAPVASFPAVSASGVWTGTAHSVVAALDTPALAVSLDAGATWATVPPPVAGGFVDVARVEGDYLYALSNERIYRRPVAGLTTAAAVSPGTETLRVSATPNPSVALATLRFSLAEPQTVRASVTDVLGREVLAAERTLGAGAQALPLDVRSLAPGVYVARIVSSGASASVRFTVAR